MLLLREKVCPNCSKVFIVENTEGWVYKTGGKYYCRWNCYRAARSGKKTNSSRVKDKVIHARPELVDYRKSLGLTQYELSLILGVSNSIVNCLENRSSVKVKCTTKHQLEKTKEGREILKLIGEKG